MVTAGALRHALSCIPDATPVELCVVTRSGLFHDRHYAQLDVVDVAFAAGELDAPVINAVWLTASQPSVEPPPMVQRVVCGCGAELLLDDTDEWPAGHDHC